MPPRSSEELPLQAFLSFEAVQEVSLPNLIQEFTFEVTMTIQDKPPVLGWLGTSDQTLPIRITDCCAVHLPPSKETRQELPFLGVVVYHRSQNLCSQA